MATSIRFISDVLKKGLAVLSCFALVTCVMHLNKHMRLSVTNGLLILLACVATLFLCFNLGTYNPATARKQPSTNYGIAGFSPTRPQGRTRNVSSTGVPEMTLGSAVTVSDLEWSAEELPPFYLVDLPRERVSSEPTKVIADCQHELPADFCAFLYAANRRVYHMKEAHVFLVPIFQSVFFTQKGLYESVMQLKSHRYFMRFRGSDFVFICYTTDCSATRSVLLEALGKSVRAIWVDRGGKESWPCTNRKIDVDTDTEDDSAVTDWVKESKRIETILQQAGERVNGRERWRCESQAFWGLQEKPYFFDFSTIKDTSFKSINEKVAYCGVPKVGSSVAVLLMRRMNNMKDWKKSNTLQIRNFHTGYNWTYKGKPDIAGIFNETGWVKGMLVRNPITRLLSGYRSKIVQLREYSRVPGGWPSGSKPPSLKQFVERIKNAKSKGNLDWTDRHIRPQSALCGVRTLPYDFIGRYEDRQEDMQAFLESLELWEKLGKSGWGPDGTAALYAEDEHIIRQNKPKPVTHADSKDMIRQYYSRDLLQTVMHIYEEDFRRFGFSKNLDDYL